MFFKLQMSFGSIIKVVTGRVEAVGGAVVQVGTIVILKIIMRLRQLQVAVVVVEHGTGLVVEVVVLKQERRNQVRLVITVEVLEETVQPQVLHRVDMAEVQDNMDKQHLHNRVMDVTVEISIPIHLQ